MNKRTFLKTLSHGVLASLATPAFLGCGSQPREADEAAAVEPVRSGPGPDKNWIWIHPGTERSADDWKRIFARLKAHGIDAVIPEVYAGQEALFEHPHALVDTKKPVLEMLIPLAKEAGLEIHAWMWTMPNNNEKIAAAHPDWYAVNGLGEPAHEKPAYVPYYKFMCPRRPAVRDFVEGTVETLSKFSDLDGVHLDYVRLPDVILAKGLWAKYDIVQDREYPQYDYCYCEQCRAEFREQTGIDPLTDLEDPSANEAWRQFRYDGVTGLVNGRLAPMAKKYGKLITAAVFPNWQYVRQQWHRWDLDGFLPMLYHSFYEEDVAWVGEQTKAALERLDYSKPVYAGLFVPALTAEELPQAIEAGRKGGSNGTSFFSYGSMTDEHWNSLKG